MQALCWAISCSKSTPCTASKSSLYNNSTMPLEDHLGNCPLGLRPLLHSVYVMANEGLDIS